MRAVSTLDSMPLAAQTEHVGNLVRRAMALLRSDREGARRCLNDASALLQSQSPDSVGIAPAIDVFRPGGLARWQARRTLTYIEANLGSSLDVAELACVAGCSRSHFSRAFKRSLGFAPMEYVTTRRVERAKVMMTSTGERLTEIALACGFADQSHLNRSFRRIVGVSPGLWRRSNPETVGSMANMPPRSTSYEGAVA
jgi:AraC family transcriptional regulator